MKIEELVRNQAYICPHVEGPIAITEKSHPFCAMQYSRKPLDVSEYDYIEEEYFLSASANVYNIDQQDSLILEKERLNYKNRILVRYPKDKDNFSGRVYVDILNATQKYDIEDLWHRNYKWCMRNGHAYVGITSKPINVQSLKNFDYNRYCSLNWSSGEQIPMPPISKSAVIPGTEEGLIWDMLGQLCFLLKYGDGLNVLGGVSADEVYLCGQSQSGAYLNTYISYFDRILAEGPYKLYDGYMNIVGALVQRSVKQQENVGELSLELRHMHRSCTPYICISSEADLTLFNMFLTEGNLLDVVIDNRDSKDDKCRYYEFPGTPHTDIICPVLASLEEIRKTGADLPDLDDKYLADINDFPLEVYICGMLEKLHIWAVAGDAPEIHGIIERKGGKLVFDQFGNAKGGFRTPFLDVPLAKYIACNPDNPEGISGKMEYFSKEEAEKIYGCSDNYLVLFKKNLEDQIRNNWVPEMFKAEILAWAEKSAAKVFKI